MIKFLCSLLLISWVVPSSKVAGPVPSPWHVNMDEARQLARKEHKQILLNFSGSDWCGPCIMLRKEIFDNAVFLAYADSNLVLVNADFPRLKKNQLPKDQQQGNDRLADKYNAQGKFPMTLLLDADGNILKQWEGYTGWKPEEFIAQVRPVIDQQQHH